MVRQVHHPEQIRMTKIQNTKQIKPPRSQRITG
jgi:hypothetical protein